MDFDYSTETITPDETNILTIGGTGGLEVPMGSTAQRPSTPTPGMIRYNTALNCVDTYEGVNWITSSGVLNKSTVTQTINVDTLTNIFSISLPGNTLNTDNVLRLVCQGYMLPTANRTCTVTVSYGATVMWEDTTPSLSSGSRSGWSLELFLTANDSATSQSLTGTMTFGPTGTPTSGTTGNFGSAFFTSASIAGSSAIASSTAQTFSVSVSFNGTNAGFVKRFHLLEKL